MSGKQNREAAQQTLRQFAWNLAGTLADKQRSTPKPGSSGAKRG